VAHVCDAVQALLRCHTWAVVGLSGEPSRPAYGVASFLQSKGKRIVPVHPSAPLVHGQQGYASLAEIPFPVDVAEFFVRSERVGPLVDQALAVGVTGVWLQLGVVDDAAAERTRAAGALVVMDRCPHIEWAQHGPR